MLPRGKATLESCRVFRVFGMKSFRSALAEAEQVESDDFAESLSGAAKYFSAKQLEQISSWRGLTISAATRDDAEVGDEEEEVDETHEDLDEQLKELQDEIDDPEGARKRKREKELKRLQEEAEKRRAGMIAKTRPDWKGRAAPNTPAAAAARQWVANRGGPQKGYKCGGKSWGKGGPRPWRSMGIASLDESARMHGNSAGEFEFGQQSRYSDRDARFMKTKSEDAEDEDEDQERPAKRRVAQPMPRLPKGIPTLAPMTPAPESNMDDL